MLHDTLVAALTANNIEIIPSENWSDDFLVKKNNLYLTWNVESGRVVDLHSTPYNGQATMTLPEIDYSRIVYHKSIAYAVKLLNENSEKDPLVEFRDSLPEDQVADWDQFVAQYA